MQKSDLMWAESAASLKTATGGFQDRVFTKQNDRYDHWANKNPLKTNKNICLNALDEDEAAAKHSRSCDFQIAMQQF